MDDVFECSWMVTGIGRRFCVSDTELTRGRGLHCVSESGGGLVRTSGSLRLRENLFRSDDLLLTSGAGGSVTFWETLGDGGAGVYVRGAKMKCSGSGEG